MTPPTLLRSFDDLVTFLQADGATCRAHPESSYVEVATEAEPLLLRWERDATLIQAILPLPVTVPEERVAAVESAIVRTNHGLPIPGFGMEPEHRVVYYRLAFPRREDGALSSAELARMIETAVDTVRHHTPIFQTTASAH